MTAEIKEIFPACFIVHWPTGPVICCEEHANKLRGVGQVLSVHTHIEIYLGDEQCENCINEKQKEK